MPSGNNNQYAGAGSGWTNAGNIGGNDASYATDGWSRFIVEGFPEENPTAVLIASSFGHSVPGAPTGVLLELEGKKGASSPSGSWLVYMLKGGTIIGSKTIGALSTSDTVHSGGGSTDLWGGTLTQAEVASLNFQIQAVPSSGTGGDTIYVDFVRATVYYEQPNSFSFTDLTNQSLNTTVASGSVSISGLTQPSPVNVSGAGSSEWRKNGGSWTSGAGTVSNGDSVEVRHTTSNSFSTAVNTILTIGGVSDTFTTTTQASDTTPDAFSFSDSGGHEPSTTAVSNTISVSGINAPASISVSGGTYSKNGAGHTSSPGTVNNGDSVQVAVTTSGSFGGTADVTLTIGGVSDTFTATTRAADTTPNAYTWTDQSGVALNTLITSNTVTINGIEAATTISFTSKTNGTTQAPASNPYEYRINAGTWLNATGTPSISNGQTLQLRLGSNGSAGVSATITTNIGGVSDTWSVTTTTGDTTPDAFTWVDNPAAAASAVVESNIITISGIDNPATIAFSNSGGSSYEYRKNGGAWTAASGSPTVSNGDTLQLRLTSPATIGNAANMTTTIGGVADTWTVTSTPDDPIPNSFTFTDQAGVDTAIVVTSDIITISGLNVTASVSIAGGGGEYRKNGGSWVTSPGTAFNGDTFQVRLTSAATRATTVSTTLTVGGISDTFSVTTSAPDAASQYVKTFRETPYGVA